MDWKEMQKRMQSILPIFKRFKNKEISALLIKMSEAKDYEEFASLSEQVAYTCEPTLVGWEWEFYRLYRKALL